MKAYKCDRCGKLYQGKISVPDIVINKYTHPYSDDKIDLCDECQRKLEKWLKKEIEF